MKTLQKTETPTGVVELVELDDGRYQVRDPGAHHGPTERLETAEYDYRKAVAAREGRGPAPLAWHLAAWHLASEGAA
jgi:hypothetical protein